MRLVDYENVFTLFYSARDQFWYSKDRMAFLNTPTPPSIKLSCISELSNIDTEAMSPILDLSHTFTGQDIAAS